MTSIAPPDPVYDMDQYGVTQTVLFNWAACRTWASLYLRYWSLPTPMSAALMYGDVGHFLVDQHFKNKVKKADTMKFLKAGMKAYKKGNPEYFACGFDIERFNLICTQLQAVLPVYFDYSRREAFKTLETELQFRSEFHDFIMVGKIDGVLSLRKKPKDIWLREYKFKEKIDEGTIRDSLGFNFQNLYYLSAYYLLTGTIPKGVLYTIIRKPGLKFLDRESLPEHKDRVIEHIEKSSNDYYFKKFEVTYPKKQVMDFMKTQLLPKLTEFSQWNQGYLPTYRGEKSCAAWGCEFTDFCNSGKMIGYMQRDKLFPELED